MSAIRDTFEQIVIQLATPYNTGTGFYLKPHHLIVTNEHIVRDNKEVIIKGAGFSEQLVKVVYTDTKYDLAFLEAPSSDFDFPDAAFTTNEKLTEKAKVYSIGHPYGMAFSEIKAAVTDPEFEYEGVRYINYLAQEENGNNGGPLVNESGQLIGINTLGFEPEGQSGTALPVSYLKETLKAFSTADGNIKARCLSCLKIVSDQTIKQNKYCPHCNAKVQLASHATPYEPGPVAQTIEELLSSIGQDVRLSRRGPNNWEIHQGSARIDITYHDDTGLIMGDAYLCQLPQENVQPAYEFMLRKNYEMQGLTFSIKDQNIIISLLIFDRYLNLETGTKLFQHLFERADYFDNVLVEQYGAKWRVEL